MARGMQTRIDAANLSLVAAGGAFFSMLSVFPGLAAVITLIGFFAEPSMIQEQMQLLAEFMPPEAFDIVSEQIRRMVLTNSSTLGWATAISVVAALWSARKGTDALVRGLNAVYHGPSRSGVYAAALSFALTLGLSLVVLVAILALVIVPLFSTILNLPFIASNVPPELLSWVNGFVLLVARWTIALAVVLTGVWLLYRFAPNVKLRLTGFFTPGALLSIAVWGAATAGFSFYISNFGNYSQVYGSIGAVIALLMFLYITIFVVLLGAALNAELESEMKLAEEEEQTEAQAIAETANPLKEGADVAAV